MSDAGKLTKVRQRLSGSWGLIVEYYASFNFTGTFTGSRRSCLRKRLQTNYLQLVPVVGLEPTRLLKAPGF